MSSLALLPVLAFFGLWLRFAAAPGDGRPAGVSLTYALIASSVLWGVLVALSSEILGILGLISRIPLALFWFATFILAVRWTRLRDSIDTVRSTIGSMFRALDGLEVAVLAFIALVLCVTFAIAIVSPPNNSDSLLYHMARVAHWAQDHSLDHYATAYDHQLFMPIWTETAILHFRVLFGSDLLSNLIQWFSFLGCIFMAGQLARLLGRSRKGQLLSAVFVATIPLALLESTSTQNDLAVAYWLSCLAFLILYGLKNRFDLRTTVLIGAVTGLGVLTKVTFYVYATPAWVALGFAWCRKTPRRQAASRMGIAAAIILLLNLGFWMRNIETFGNPIGPNDLVRSFASTVSNPQVTTESDPVQSQNPASPSSRGAAILGTFLVRERRMVLWNIGVPLSPLRGRIPGINTILRAVLDEDQYSGLRNALWNHEDTAGNPIHITIIAIAMLALIFPAVRGSVGKTCVRYGLLVLLAYILLPVAISNADTLFALRFQLPFLVLSGPIVAGSFDASIPSRWLPLLAFGLCVAALPWLLLNNTRPVIGWEPGITRVGSVFRSGRSSLLFAMKSGEQDEYQAVTSKIAESDCRRVGLMLDSHDYEYLFWYLLGAPESGIEIQSVVASNDSSKYLDRGYSPCAVICTYCVNQDEAQGLGLRKAYAKVQLFMQAGY